jgi:cytochrome c-type biogenesis protein CcmH
VSFSTRARWASARRAAAIVLALMMATLTIATPATAAPKPRASLTNIDQDVMCVTCHEPLEVAQSPQAVAERSYISSLIAKGETKTQIENALVGQYGPAVLGVPKARGFNLTVYILPPALLLVGIASLAVILPRWRRRARAAAAQAAPPGPPLDPTDARRLDEELARYDG